MDKKTIFSGIKPTGKLTLGNYIGAINEWEKMQEDYNCIYCIVDLHALTISQNPAEFRKRTLEQLALYMALGIDPEKSTIYIQSHVEKHSELAWLLSCITYMGELNRMTQYKDKIQKGGQNINAGLFNYPVLMAADILLYGTDLVPVGDDQKQHVEIARDIAERFNNKYSDTFVVPEIYIPKTGARIMDLQNPSVKMSKSEVTDSGCIYIIDEPNVIKKKIKRAVTDSEGTITYADDRPAIKNLINIYSSMSGKEVKEIEAMYNGKGYGEFKEDLGNIIVDKFSKPMEKYNELLKDKEALKKIYTEGATKADRASTKIYRKVRKKIGLIPKEF